jgi:hypothetical protein
MFAPGRMVQLRRRTSLGEASWHGPRRFPCATASRSAAAGRDSGGEARGGSAGRDSESRDSESRYEAVWVSRADLAVGGTSSLAERFQFPCLVTDHFPWNTTAALNELLISGR